ncbi:MAG: hypothetical protein K1060chlam2_00456 [Chlamydiae bacterium]|nr:hypothetical protein [Chlamydiota bacterium]
MTTLVHCIDRPNLFTLYSNGTSDTRQYAAYTPKERYIQDICIKLIHSAFIDDSKSVQKFLAKHDTAELKNFKQGLKLLVVVGEKILEKKDTVEASAAKEESTLSKMIREINVFADSLPVR